MVRDMTQQYMGRLHGNRGRVVGYHQMIISDGEYGFTEGRRNVVIKNIIRQGC